MFDKFMDVLAEREKKAQVTDEMTEMLKKLPVNEISKVAYCGDPGNGKTWLSKYEGSPLYDKAVALEEELLQIEGQRIQKRLDRPIDDDLYTKEDMIRLKKRMLDLELSKAKATGEAPEELEEEEESEEEEEPEEDIGEPIPQDEAKTAEAFVQSMAKEAQGGYDPGYYGLGYGAAGAAIPMLATGVPTPDVGLASGLGAYYGAQRGAPSGRAGEGAAKGAGGAAAGYLGGGLLGGLGGGALGAGLGYAGASLLGPRFGIDIDPRLAALGGGAGGALLGGGVGGVLGGRKGYRMATEGLEEPKYAELNDPVQIARLVKQAMNGGREATPTMPNQPATPLLPKQPAKTLPTEQTPPTPLTKASEALKKAEGMGPGTGCSNPGRRRGQKGEVPRKFRRREGQGKEKEGAGASCKTAEAIVSEYLQKMAKKDGDSKSEDKKPEVNTRWRPPQLPTPDYIGDSDIYAKRLANRVIHKVLKGVKSTETKAKRTARRAMGKESSIQNVASLFEQSSPNMFRAVVSPYPKA